MVLVNDMGKNSIEETPQLASKRQERKQKQNDQEEKDDDSKILYASNVELADAVPSGQQNVEEGKVPMLIRSHSYNVFTERQVCNIFLDHPNQKLSPSHNQLLNLVAHCLDWKDIPLFLSIYNSIKYHHPPDTTKKSHL